MIMIYNYRGYEIMTAELGTGDNMLPEDYNDGYVGYINVNTFASNDPEADDENLNFPAIDGGMHLFKEHPATQEDVLRMMMEESSFPIPVEELVVLYDDESDYSN